MTDALPAAGEKWLTIQETAAVLNVGQAFVIKLINGGALSCRETYDGRHIRQEDALAYKAESNRRQEEAFDQLVRDDKAKGEK